MSPPSGVDMVLPVTGPYERTQIFKGPPNMYGYHPNWVWIRRKWYRQKKPYTAPLAFECSIRRIVSQNNTIEYTTEYSSAEGNSPFYPTEPQHLYNKAYESFMGNVRQAQADVMTLMRERQKTLSMISNRALQLAAFVQFARKRNLAGMRSVVKHAYTGDKSRSKLESKVGWRKHSRSTGGTVLEASFGWAPLASDLANAMQVFRNGPPAPYVKGRAKLSGSTRYNAGYEPEILMHVTETIGWHLRARVRCVDSDIYLLNQLGLINVASSVWETTPWSFAFDYFVNMQTFLNSFTDRLGLEFEDASSTFLRVQKLNRSYGHYSYTPPPGGWPNMRSESIDMIRSLGISRPTLAWRSPWSLSPQRALTSIALLLQKLKG